MTRELFDKLYRARMAEAWPEFVPYPSLIEVAWARYQGSTRGFEWLHHAPIVRHLGCSCR